MSAPGFAFVADLVEAVGATPAGSTVMIPVDGPAAVDVVARWCDATGNEVLTVHEAEVEVHRGPIADPIAALAPERRPGHRLWVYTNFTCNLSCDYCCVESSPRADPRIIPTEEFAALVEAAVDAGVQELFLTGGEPFLLLDLDERLRVATDALPTTVLTNGMVWSGERARRFHSLPHENLVLQISLDSPDAELHDRHRGAGSHARALAGIAAAMEAGFRVRVAATLGPGSEADEKALEVLFDDLGLDPDQRVVRRIARQGAANSGLVVSRSSLLPEVCVTTAGVWWHPVAAIDPTMKVRDGWAPLDEVIADVTGELREHRLRGDVLASTFPCA